MGTPAGIGSPIGVGRPDAGVEQQDRAQPLVALDVGRLALRRDEQPLAGGVDGQEGREAARIEGPRQRPGPTVLVSRVRLEERDLAERGQRHPCSTPCLVDGDLARITRQVHPAHDARGVGATVEEGDPGAVGEGDEHDPRLAIDGDIVGGARERQPAGAPQVG